MIGAVRFLVIMIVCARLLQGQVNGPPSMPDTAVPGDVIPDETSLSRAQRRIQRRSEKAQDNGQLRREGVLLWRWSENLLSAGNPVGAIEKLREAVTLLEKAGSPDAGLARVLLTLGRLHRVHGHHHQALPYLERALNLFLDLEDRLGESRARHLLGIVYFQIGRPSQGLAQFEQSLSAARETSARQLYSRMAALGYGYVRLGEYPRAIALLEDFRGQTVEDLRPTVYWILSSAYFHAGRSEAARRVAGEGVQSARSRGNLQGLLSSLLWRSRALHRLGRTEEAAVDAEEALVLIENLRSRLVPSDFMKIGVADQYVQHINNAVEVLYALGRYSRAFEIAEQGRARAFLDLLAGRTAAGSAIPDLDIDELESIVPANEPALASAVSAPAASLAEAIAMAKRLSSTVVAYWINPKGTYVWVVHADGTIHSRLHRLSEQRLKELIRRAQSRSEADRQALRELYRHLIAPVRQYLPAPGSRLTIIPHGPVFGLPFAALIDARGRYFVEDYALHYAPAVAAFERAGPRMAHNGASTRYLLAANPTNPPALPDGTPLPALPGSQLEIERISGVLTARSVSTLTGQGLRIEELRKSMADSAVIHFASHAVIDSADPLGSFLALSNSERLTARDVYSLSLQAELVLLSACRSASGPVSLEGVLGLTRAFFYAGARSVVASIWDVADEPSGDLMAEFHRQYQRTGQKDRSLRDAQLRFLEALRKGRVRARTPAGMITLPEHPALWAGFVLLGDPA